MLKKYSLFFFIIVFSFVINSGNTEAVINKTGCNPNFTDNQNCTGQIVSASDFADTFRIQGKDTPGDKLTFFGNFLDGKGDVAIISSPASPITVNSSGIAETTVNYTWPVKTLPQTYQVAVKAKDVDTAQSPVPASYKITLSYAPIGITGTVDGASFTWGGTLAQGKTLKTTCTNSTNMKVGLDGGPYSSVGTKNGYTITYDFPNNNTGTTALTYKIICQNIGGTANEQARTFNLAPTIPSPSGNINATGCTILSGASTCNGSINWTTTNPTHTSQVTSNYPAANTTVATGNSNSGMSVTIPYSSRAFFLYHNGAKLGEATATATCTTGTSWDGSKCAPTPPANCLPVERWNAATGKCMSGTITPQNCLIAYNGSSCNATIGWSTTDPVKTSQVTSPYPSAGTVVATANSGSQSVLIPYSSRTFFLYNNGAELDRKVATATCNPSNGTTWDGSKCACPTNTSWDSASNSCKSMSSSLSAPNCYILGNANSCNTTLSWSISYPTGNTAVTSSYPSANTVLSTAHTGSQTISVPYPTRAVFLYNSGTFQKRADPIAECYPGTSWDGSSCVCPTGHLWNASARTCNKMTGTLPQKSCTIRAGASSCDISLTWTTTNPIETSAVTSNSPNNGTTVATGNNNTTGFTASVPYSSRSFFLYNDGTLLATMIATSACETSSSWDAAAGKCSSPTGTLTATDCTIAYGAKDCDTTLKWTTANPIGTSAVTSNSPNNGTTVATGNNNTTGFVAKAFYPSRSFFLYNDGVERASDVATATCNPSNRTTWDGSKCACPASAPIWDATNGYCRKECYYGEQWNPTTNECENICPPGQLYINGTCMDRNRQPICTWKDMTFQRVTCDILFYPCEDRTQSTFNVSFRDGKPTRTIQSGTSAYESPNEFKWEDGGLYYNYVCPNNTWRADALKRPYTHFVTFEASAGQIRKGSTINLSWNVQLPNSSCKIVGTSLKTGNVIFNSASFPAINTNITKPITSVTPGSLNYSTIGDYRTLMSDFLTINESTRFTASCVDTGYSKGYSQLVRDVYVVDEADR